MNGWVRQSRLGEVKFLQEGTDLVWQSRQGMVKARIGRDGYGSRGRVGYEIYGFGVIGVIWYGSQGSVLSLWDRCVLVGHGSTGSDCKGV